MKPALLSDDIFLLLEALQKDKKNAAENKVSCKPALYSSPAHQLQQLVSYRARQHNYDY